MINDFDFRQLNLQKAFGNSEGENDSLDEKNFIITKSIEQFLSMDYNYIISPKGGGKSALFKALNDGIIPKDYFDSSKYFIINIDSAFLFGETYLDSSKFKISDSYKDYIISWGSYLLNRIIRKIINFRDQFIDYQLFQNEIKKYEYIKDDFELYNVIDKIHELQLAVSVVIGGLPIEIAPKLKFGEARPKKIKLNDLFELINDFFRKNNVTLLILIDRIDNFVKREEYSVQEKYLQGLVSTIEELIIYKNIKPILFIRSDLYNTFNLSAEYDKTKQRSLRLIWKQDEILRFILTRFLSIEYINKNFFNYLYYLIYLEYKNKNKKSFKVKLLKILELFGYRYHYEFIERKKRYNPTINMPFRISSYFIKLFIPENVEHYNIDRKPTTTKFCDWQKTHFTDKNGIVHPRIIINFFNELFQYQYEIYEKDYPELILNRKQCSVNQINDYYYLNVFMSEAMQTCYENTQNDELIKIYNLINTKKERNIFLEINSKSYLSGTFNINDIDLKSYKIDQKNYNNLIQYLILLGFFEYSSEKKDTLNIPILFMKKISLENIKIVEFDNDDD